MLFTVIKMQYKKIAQKLEQNFIYSLPFIYLQYLEININLTIKNLYFILAIRPQDELTKERVAIDLVVTESLCEITLANSLVN